MSTLAPLRGWESFAGQVVEVGHLDLPDLTGRRVAVLVTDARTTAAVAKVVAAADLVKVFHSTPTWVIPRLGLPGPVAAPVRRALRSGPAARSGVTALLGRAHLRRSVPDPWTRRQLTPDPHGELPPVTCSSRFYRALQHPSCQLVTWPIATVSPAGIRTCDGIEHAVDRIVVADGTDLAGRPTPSAHA